MSEMQKVLIVEVMADFAQLELDNLRHEIENLVGVFSVKESQPTQRAADVCNVCGAKILSHPIGTQAICSNKHCPTRR